MMYVSCPKCATYLGQARSGEEVKVLTKEHVPTCEG